MIDFETYYQTRFQKDILRFFSTVPDRSKFIYDDNQTPTIQYQTLSKDFQHLDFLDSKEKALFGAALFFIVLVDQVCFSFYNEHYDKFRQLTLSPKFVGNSPSTDRTNFHPANIFAAFNYSREDNKKNETERIEFNEVLKQSVQTMETEIKNFFKKHLPEIDGQEFWSKCINELPTISKLKY